MLTDSLQQLLYPSKYPRRVEFFQIAETSNLLRDQADNLTLSHHASHISMENPNQISHKNEEHQTSHQQAPMKARGYMLK